MLLKLLQSEVFSNGGGERTKLLTSFCDYQGKNNPGDDSHPEHWDIGYNYLSNIIKTQNLELALKSEPQTLNVFHLRQKYILFI